METLDFSTQTTDQACNAARPRPLSVQVPCWTADLFVLKGGVLHCHTTQLRDRVQHSVSNCSTGGGAGHEGEKETILSLGGIRREDELRRYMETHKHTQVHVHSTYKCTHTHTHTHTHTSTRAHRLQMQTHKYTCTPLTNAHTQVHVHTAYKCRHTKVHVHTAYKCTHTSTRAHR